MKFNYKLGGTIFIIKSKIKYFEEPIIIININIFYIIPRLK